MAKKSEVIFGYHAIEEYLKRGLGGTLWIVAGKEPARRRVAQLESAARSRGITVRVARDRMELALSCGIDPTGAAEVVLVLAPMPQAPAFGRGDEPVSLEAILPELGDESLVLLLDGITDVQNLGAIIRCADQFEVSAVIIPTHKSAHQSATVGRTSAGASAHVRVIEVKNLTRAIETLKAAAFWIYGAEAGGEVVSSCSFTGKNVLVMGSEGKGISRLVRENCDKLVSIPTRGHVDSLNVSVATGILLYEIRRQQWHSAEAESTAESQRNRTD
ncbi:MAG TPA: 23S rRNA (guanosine(2251)-2'-O)-methyltransferase RlmB [Spirochaetia bacterium]|nr:23S rRNA (guanosine(2251)-2'-O)-methyltransferase RlmB [Spirochaetia bacterium]